MADNNRFSATTIFIVAENDVCSPGGLKKMVI